MSYSTTRLLNLKFYLNKFVKADNIEMYPISDVIKMWTNYQKWLEKNEGNDPDFPDKTMNFDK